jgi:hypothetical protein
MIPLIHNYCDRWCERCTFTSQCSVFAKTSHLSEEELDIKNENFWKFLQDTFEEALTLLQKKMEEMGIPPPTEQELIDSIEEEDAKFEKVMQHEMLKTYQKYRKDIEPFLSGYLDELIKEKAENRIRLNLTENQEEKLFECYEVIQWYRSLAEAKLFRALSGFYEIEEDNELRMFDCNGSAKIALISIERSLWAWKMLYDLLPEKEDEILDYMILLQQTKVMTEQLFPNVYSFIRPGFDE